MLIRNLLGYMYTSAQLFQNDLVVFSVIVKSSEFY